LKEEQLCQPTVENHPTIYQYLDKSLRGLE